MANNLLTPDMITRMARRLFRNSNAFIQNITREYDSSFAVPGAKIGTTLRIRLPNDYIVRQGAAAQIQDTNEQQTTLTVATQSGVDVAFNSIDRTMKLDDVSERVLAPMMNNLAGDVAKTIMSGLEGQMSNFIANLSGSTVINPTADTFLTANAILDDQSAPDDDTLMRKIMVTPRTMAHAVSTFSTLFNSQQQLAGNYRKGKIQGETWGMGWYKDQTVVRHTPGSYNSAATVNGANQTGTSITVTAISGNLAVGDFITLTDVYAVNRVTKQSTGNLMQFVITQAASNGATTLNIYPAITPPSGGQAVQYQTVTQSPANGASVTLITGQGAPYTRNIVYTPEAITMVTADLEMPGGGVIEAERGVLDSLSMRMVSQYDIFNDRNVTRFDILYGYLGVRPEWAVVLATPLT